MIGDISFGRIFRELSTKNRYFFIANYQRFLSWERKEWEEFWETVETILLGERKKVCLSFISQYKDPNEDYTEQTEGQQRFTIVVLFALACYKFLMKEEVAARSRRDPNMDPADKTEEEIKIQDSMDLVKPIFLFNKKPTLRFFDTDTDTIFSELVTSPINPNLPTQMVIDKYKDSIIIEEYLYLYSKLTSDNIHSICNIINGEECSGVSVDYGLSLMRGKCESKDECSDFFNNQDKGKKLEAVEIMHSHFICLTNKFFNNDTEKREKDKYCLFLHKLRNTYEDTNDFSKFYQLYFYLKHIEHKQKTELRREFCNKKFKDSEEYKNFLDDLGSFFELYKSICDRKAEDVLEPLNSYLRFDLDRGFFTWHMIIDIIRNKDFLSKSDIRKTLDICYSLLLRRKVAGQRGGSDTATLRIVENAVVEAKESGKPYIETLINVIKSKSRPGVFGYLDNNEFFAKFLYHDFYKDKDALKYVLLRLNFVGKDVSEFEGFGIDPFTIEHTMPRKGNLSNMYLNTIGNLTLVSSSLNSQLGILSFEKKKELYKQSDFSLNSYYETVSVWNDSEILKRAEYFIKLMEQDGFLNI